MTTTTQLKSVSEKLTEKEGYAALDLSGWDPRTVQGMQAMKQGAIREVDSIKEQYQKLLEEILTPIFVVGGTPAQLEEFYNVVEDDGTAYRLSANDLYRRLADRVTVTLGRDSMWSVQQHMAVLDLLRDICKELSIVSMPDPSQACMGMGLGSPEDIMYAVHVAIEKAVGHDLLQLYLARKTIDLAVKDRWIQPVLPCVIFDATPEQVQAMFTNRAKYVINLNEEKAEANTLTKVFKKIESDRRQH